MTNSLHMICLSILTPIHNLDPNSDFMDVNVTGSVGHRSAIMAGADHGPACQIPSNSNLVTNSCKGPAYLHSYNLMYINSDNLLFFFSGIVVYLLQLVPASDPNIYLLTCHYDVTTFPDITDTAIKPLLRYCFKTLNDRIRLKILTRFLL